MSLPSISQTVITTTRDTAISIPIRMVKLIVADLEEGDLIKQERLILSNMIDKYKSQLFIQNQIIEAKDLKNQNLELIITEKDKIVSICNQEKNIIKKKVKQSFITGTLTGISIGVLSIGVLTILLL